MQPSVSLGEFLRSRRAAADPGAAGVRSITRRRVEGLRREEVAMLAGVSVAYYTRLEQGKASNASDEVLLAIARALGMTSTETEHLLDLGRRQVRPDHADAASEQAPERASDNAIAILGALWQQPALLLGRDSDVLAWTPLGHALIAPHLDFSAPDDPATRPNLPRMLFLDPAVRDSYDDWEHEAATFVANLRLVSGKHPEDPRLARLVGELCVKDDEFAAMWATGRVGECTTGVKRMTHPLVGAMRIGFQLWQQAERPEHRIEMYSAADEATADAVSILASWAATGDARPHEVPQGPFGR